MFRVILPFKNSLNLVPCIWEIQGPLWSVRILKEFRFLFHDWLQAPPSAELVQIRKLFTIWYVLVSIPYHIFTRHEIQPSSLIHTHTHAHTYPIQSTALVSE